MISICPDCGKRTVEAIADPEWVVADTIVEVEGVTGWYCMYCERLVSVTLTRLDAGRGGMYKCQS